MILPVVSRPRPPRPPSPPRRCGEQPATGRRRSTGGTRGGYGNPAGHAAPTVAALCEEFSAVCESAVDPLEIASALEFDGFSDQLGPQPVRRPTTSSRWPSDMYLRVPRRPADPAPPPEPWRGGRLRPLLHGLLYALPAVCFPAAAGLLHGPAVVPALIVALLVAWSTEPGAGLPRLPAAGPDRRTRTRSSGCCGPAWPPGLVLVALAMAGGRARRCTRTGRCWCSARARASTCSAPCVLMVLGHGGMAAGRAGARRAGQRRVPGVLGRPRSLQHAGLGRAGRHAAGRGPDRGGLHPPRRPPHRPPADRPPNCGAPCRPSPSARSRPGC